MTRTPNRSISGPTSGAVVALVTWRADCAQPKTARPAPSSSPIGLMNRPKLSAPMHIVRPPVTAITATITQP